MENSFLASISVERLMEKEGNRTEKNPTGFSFKLPK